MRVYMASFYYNSGSDTQSLDKRITYLNRTYPWILESFHYMDRKIVMDIRADKRTIFLDSGAFSSFTLGVKLDLNRYTEFLKACKDIIHVASNIDVIGEGKEEETYANQKKLEQLLGRGVVCPVHHVRDHDDWLRRYLDEGYDYIFLGGMVPESVPVLKQWLDRIWSKYLTNPDGTAKVKVHGFGLTTEELMERYPWYSVDSTSWLLTAAFGYTAIDIPQADGSVKRFKVAFSEHSPDRYGIDSWHFWSLKQDEQEAIRKRLAELEAARTWKADTQLEKDFKLVNNIELAYTPEAIAKSYGLRRVISMDYYDRMLQSHTNVFEYMQETLF